VLFRGVHVINHGLRKGSRKVARAIEDSGMLRVGSNNWHGRGVYGHFEQYLSLYEGKPYVVFEAEIDAQQVKTVRTTLDREFFVILCDDGVPIKIVGLHNVED